LAGTYPTYQRTQCGVVPVHPDLDTFLLDCSKEIAMKKKTELRKILLHRETLRQLDPEQLTSPYGGATLSRCDGSCASCVCGGTLICTR
jgi:hypothetical protein